MTRDEMRQALRQTRSRLLETIDGIPEDVIVTQSVTGSWTIKDLLGHMAMWQQVGLSFITDYRASGTPQSLGLENDAAVDAYNRRGADLRRGWSLARVRAELEDAQRNLLSAVESLSEDDLHKALPAPWHSATTLEQLIAINSYEHDPEHIEQIKRWKEFTAPSPGKTNRGQMKVELLEKLNANRDQLLDAVAGLTEEQLTTVPVVGEWTIKDAIGHIAYWEGIILDHVRESYIEGRPRQMRDDENDDIVNPREAAKRKHRPWPSVQTEFMNVRAALIGKIESLSESDLSFQVPNPWWNETRFYSVAQMVEEDAIGHCREHFEQIQKWKQSMLS